MNKNKWKKVDWILGRIPRNNLEIIEDYNLISVFQTDLSGWGTRHLQLLSCSSLSPNSLSNSLISSERTEFVLCQYFEVPIDILIISFHCVWICVSCDLIIIIKCDFERIGLNAKYVYWSKVIHVIRWPKFLKRKHESPFSHIWKHFFGNALIEYSNICIYDYVIVIVLRNQGHNIW